MSEWIKKQVTLSSVVLSLILLVIIYYWIDSRVTIDYFEQELASRHRSIETLKSLVRQTGKSKTTGNFTEIIKNLDDQDILVKTSENEIYLDNITLKFKEGKFFDIETANDQR